MPSDWQAVENAVSEATGRPFRVASSRPVGGGCINQAAVIEGCGQRFFIKLNSAALLPMFAAEADGLRAILETGTVRAPQPLACGCSGGEAWLVLEYLEFGAGGPAAATRLGERLAAMHATPGEYFGWHRDNTIGSTAQRNAPTGDWIGFYREQRLGFQLALAAENGAPGRLLDSGRELQERLPQFFQGYSPTPSLLHGDLWGGNWEATGDGEPVIFDPAVYCGDREADIAMTELFGGFGPAFYEAYDSALPLDAGYQTRRTLYNLYHVLNHFNLFGGGYAGQARHSIDELLASVR